MDSRPSACGWRAGPGGQSDPIHYRVAGGSPRIVDFVKHLNASKEPLFKRVVSFTEISDEFEIDVAMQWNNGYYEGLHSYAA